MNNLPKPASSGPRNAGESRSDNETPISSNGSGEPGFRLKDAGRVRRNGVWYARMEIESDNPEDLAEYRMETVGFYHKSGAWYKKVGMVRRPNGRMES